MRLLEWLIIFLFLQFLRISSESLGSRKQDSTRKTLQVQVLSIFLDFVQVFCLIVFVI